MLFRLYTIFVAFTFFTLMAGVCIFAFLRPSNSTGMNMAKVQEMRRDGGKR